MVLGELFPGRRGTGSTRLLVPRPLRLSGHDIVLLHVSCVENGPTALAILNEPRSREEFQCVPFALEAACVEEITAPKDTRKEDEEDERKKKD